MHQVKIFKSIESEIPALEKQINTWLIESGARVISMTGNISPQSPHGGEGSPGASIRATPWAPSDVIVIVHYEK